MTGEVLIVDDTPENLQVLSAILRGQGLTVRLAPSGAHALRSVRARHPDLILLDIRMPEMDGFEVCRQLRDDVLTARIPVLFLSASQDSAERIQAFSDGGIDFIAKPFHADEVVARVATHLTLARLRQDLALANARLQTEVVVEQRQRLVAEQVAEDRQVRLELALNAAGIGTWVVEGAHDLIQFDQRAQHILGLDQPSLVGGWQALVAGFSVEDRSALTAISTRALSHHQTFDLEGWWQQAGERRRIRIRGRMDTDAADRALRIIGLVWDVTADHQLRARLAQSEKLESLGHLAGGLAHDFNNHLTVILGNIELLRMHVGAEEKTLRRLGNINLAALTATGLVRDLLTFARRREVTMGSLPLSTTVKELESLLRSLLGTRISLVIATGTCPLMVRGNREQLQNAVMNLCVNARDGIPGHGSLLVTVAQEQVVEGHCRVCAKEVRGSFAAITVRDDGDGIPVELQDRIFEPFFTTKPEGKGTGLGLAAVVGCVTAHHGHLLLDSRPGQGSTFRLLFPLCAESTGDVALRLG